MPIARAESEYVLVNKASGPLRDMRQEAARTKREFVDTSKALDRIGTPAQLQRLDRLERRFEKVGGGAERMKMRVNRAAQSMETTITRRVDRSIVSLERLHGELDRTGRVDARARVHVDGVAVARAELAALRADLRRFGRDSSTARVRVAGGGGGGAARATRAGAYAGSSGAGVFADIPGGKLAAAGLAALPVIQALGGATGALGGSLMGAGLGAGAVSLAGGGALGAGIAAIASVAIPAKKGVEAAGKAQAKYNAAVADFGRKSTQAKNAKREMDQAFAHAPRGTRDLLTQTRALSREWSQLTRGSQGDLLGMVATGERRLRRQAPNLARDARIVTRSTHRAGDDFTAFLGSPTVQRGLLEFSELFAHNVGTAEHIAENLASTFINIGRAAKPFFTEGTDWVDKWTHGWATSTRDVSRTRYVIGGFVDDLRDWKNLAGTAFHLTYDLLNMGRPAGSSGIVSLTNTLDRWDSWVQQNPEKVDHFFRQSIDSTGKLAGGLVQVVKALDQMATTLRPLLDRFSDLANLAGALGLLQPGALGLALGAYRGGKGAGGGRGGGGLGGGTAAAAALTAAGGRTAAGAGTRGLMGAYETYGIQRALGASRFGSAGTAGGRLLGSAGAAGGAARFGVGALRGAGKAFLPLSLLLAATDFANARGNIAQRGGSALDSALLGIPSHLGIPLKPHFKPTGDERADAFLQRNGGDPAALYRQQHHLRRLLNARQLSGGNTTVGTFTMQDKLRGDDRRQVQRELRAITPAYRQADAMAGGSAGRDLQQAFGIRQQGKGTRAARSGFGIDFAQAFRERGREGKRELTTQVGSWIEALQHGDKSSRRTADRMSRSVVARYRAMGADVRTVNEAIGSQTPRTWESIRQSLSSAAERARQSVTTSFTALQQQAIGSLTAMGYSRGEAVAITRAQEAGNAAAGAKTRRGAIGAAINAATGTTGAMSGGVGGYQGKNARGGYIPGQGLADKVQVAPGQIAAPGEFWIGNRHTEDRLNRMLAPWGTTVGREITGETTPHGAPRRYAQGGFGRDNAAWVTGDTDFKPAMLSALTRLARAAGQHINVQSGGRSASEQQALINKYGANNPSHPVAGLNGPHVQGIAADITPGRDVFGRLAGRFGLGFTVPQEPWHIQLLDAARSGALGSIGSGAAGLATAAGISLKRRRSGLRGVPGALADRASDSYRTGLQRMVNKRIAAQGGTGGFTGGGAPSANQALGQRMMLAAGFGGDQWPALKALWTRESGWSNTIRNPTSGAFGIPQALPPGKMGAAAVAGSPSAQIGWGLRYIKDRYGTPSAAWAHEQSAGWYARGGKAHGVPWFGKGGDITARRPTVIGVGDHSRGEDVTVRPRRIGPTQRHGRTTTAGVNITIENMPITYNARGDVRKVVRAELRQAFEDLADELEGGVHADEATVLG